MRRRDLLARIPLVLLAIPVIGCVGGTDDDYPLRPPGQPTGGATPPGESGDEEFTGRNQDNSGHAHTVEIRCTSLEQGRTTYIADGPHTHELELTDEDIEDLLAGRSVTFKTTSLHEHTWVLRPPSNLCG